MTRKRLYKAINFDLDTKKLRERFGENGRRMAYGRIQFFLTKNGFVHRQWSGYTSQMPMSYEETYAVVDQLAESNDWLADCVNRFDATNVTTETDMVNVIRSHQSDLQGFPDIR